MDAYNIEIIGSDIDTRVLAEAAAGCYGERALCALAGRDARGLFRAGGEDQRQIIPDLRESVTFTAANLIDAASMAAQRPVRRDLLPQRADLFRRGRRALAAVQNIYRPAQPRRIRLPRPFGVDVAHL